MTGSPSDWVGTRHATAATDCVSTVYINPRYFVADDQSLGYGIVYHEGGHIMYSPEGVALLRKARERGNAFRINEKPTPQGDLMVHIVNILLDRKDDRATAKARPGIALTLRRRLTTICSLGVAESERGCIDQHLDSLEKGSKKIDREKERLRILGSVKPSNVGEDFFMTVKWGKRAHTPEGHRARRYLAKHPFTHNTPHNEVLRTAEHIIDILCNAPTEQDLDRLNPQEYREKKEHAERRRKELTGKLAQPVRLAMRMEHGEGISQDPGAARLNGLAARVMIQFLQSGRKKSVDQLLQQLKFPSRMAGVGPTVRPPKVKLTKVPQDPKHAPFYETLRAGLEPEIRLLVERLRRLDSPTEYTLFGQDDGELDPSEAARIATGLPGIYTDTVEERHRRTHRSCSRHQRIDDRQAPGRSKRVCVMFSEALRALNKCCEGTSGPMTQRRSWISGNQDQARASDPS